MELRRRSEASWMTISHFYRIAIGLIFAVPILAACAVTQVERGVPPLGVASTETAQTAQAPLQQPPVPTQTGIYVDLQTSAKKSGILGYHIENGHPRPYCLVNGISFADRVAVDGAGALIVPDSFSSSVTVFRGPGMCGRKLGSFKDRYGQPLDAASNDAARGSIAVANIFDNSGNGSISVCTLAHGCTQNLTDSNMVEVAGVAMATNGDCWASAVNSSFASTLSYFKHCSGSGKLSTGYKNKAYGGLDIDAQGNIVSISWSGYTSELYVYQGCNPRCRLVGGPFPLLHQTMTGHLNKDGTTLMVADYQRTRVDVYSYTPTKIKYEYGFSDGLSGGTAAGVAFTPRSKE